MSNAFYSRCIKADLQIPARRSMETEREAWNLGMCCSARECTFDLTLLEQMQRIQQMHVDVDLVPRIDPEAELQPLFGESEVEAGVFLKPAQVGSVSRLLGDRSDGLSTDIVGARSESTSLPR